MVHSLSHILTSWFFLCCNWVFHLGYFEVWMTLLVLDLARRLLVSSLMVLSSLPSSNRFTEFFDHKLRISKFRKESNLNIVYQFTTYSSCNIISLFIILSTSIKAVYVCFWCEHACVYIFVTLPFCFNTSSLCKLVRNTVLVPMFDDIQVGQPPFHLISFRFNGCQWA
jgi:hypothetical protein